MSDTGLQQAQDKMAGAGVPRQAIDVFTHYYRALESGATGIIAEDTIQPLLDPAHLADSDVDEIAARDALDKTVIIKLNGGLGTSMGVTGPKSLLPVRSGQSFLDLIVAQVRHARATYDVRLPLLLMNSFRTQAESLAALAAHPDIAVPGLPADFLQNQEPKLRAEDLTPVSWPHDPSLEWCPPGHGDLYTAILTSGVLESLLAQGYRYANTSNADNLGAAPNLRLAGWFAASGAPYAAELCRRTAADRKGGHLAIRRADGRLILRDTAQTAPEDMDAFTDEHRHPYFHTNNLWFDLQALHNALTERGSVLGLPLIRNTKTVDPTDPSSPEVVQIETAMGAAIEVFDGAAAIEVARERFLPVKTTNDLLLLRSDAYLLGADGRLALAGDAAPLVDLDPTHFRTMADFESRFPTGAPSLARATSLEVRGDWTFGADVVVTGAVALADEGPAQQVPDGAQLDAPA
ncbi:MAG: UTP--glucose-1-phosphate uridylyltransferase [Candidatus Nanopelagicales bacterium]